MFLTLFLSLSILINLQNILSCEDVIYLRKAYLEKKNVVISTESYSNKDFFTFQELVKYLTLFEFSLDQRNIEFAQDIANRLQTCYPVTQLVNYRLAEYYYKLGEFEYAKECLSQCVNFDSQFHEARKLLADVCLKLKIYDEAYKHYNILSWFTPDKNVLETIDYLTNRTGGGSIIPSRKINFSSVIFSTNIFNSPNIDVGISTKDNGKLLDIDCVKFFVSNKFSIFDDKNKKLFEFDGGNDKEWTIVYRAKLGMFGIISHQLNKEYRVRSRYLIIKPIQPDTTIFVSEYKKFKKSYIQNLEYRGELVLKTGKDKFVVINRLHLEEYLYSVVSKEIGKNRPYEALKVQSVVARTLALYRKKNKAHQYFDVCKGQHCQVYDGVKSEVDNTIKAVDDTFGEIVTYNNRLIHTFFHANCGGITSLWDNFYQDNFVISDVVNEKIFKIENFYQWYLFPPVLNCSPSEEVHPGFSRWFRVIQKSLLSKYLNEKYKIEKVKNIEILSRKNNGYVKQLKIVGSKKTIILSQEHKIRNIVPNGPLRSASFIVEYNKNNDCFYFWGAGWGHGVGMCQSGVVNLATKGENYVNIIKHYYPGTEIQSCY